MALVPMMYLNTFGEFGISETKRFDWGAVSCSTCRSSCLAAFQFHRSGCIIVKFRSPMEAPSCWKKFKRQLHIWMLHTLCRVLYMLRVPTSIGRSVRWCASKWKLLRFGHVPPWSMVLCCCVCCIDWQEAALPVTRTLAKYRISIACWMGERPMHMSFDGSRCCSHKMVSSGDVIVWEQITIWVSME